MCYIFFGGDIMGNQTKGYYIFMAILGGILIPLSLLLALAVLPPLIIVFIIAGIWRLPNRTSGDIFPLYFISILIRPRTITLACNIFTQDNY